MINESFLLFAGTSHKEFAQQIAKELGIQLGNIKIETFPDGEIGVQILENVRGRDVFIVQTIAKYPNDYLMELLIIADALKRASCSSITVVIPYFGYARQDRRSKGRVPITAKLVASMIENAGISRVLTMDLHSEQIQGFFNVPIDHLHSYFALYERLRTWELNNPMIIAPDIGRVSMASDLARLLQADYGIFDKNRLNATHVESRVLIGDVKGRDVVLVDDICSTGETLKKAAEVCKNGGCRKIYAAVTHGLLFFNGLDESVIEKMVITNTVQPTKDSWRVETVSVAPLFANAIEAIAYRQSVSSLDLLPQDHFWNDTGDLIATSW